MAQQTPTAQSAAPPSINVGGSNYPVPNVDRPLYDVEFTAENFNALVKEIGVHNITTGVVDTATQNYQPGLFSYETLKDGTAPLFDLFPEYENIAPKKRALKDEAMLSLFSNVQDFGKYWKNEADPDPFYNLNALWHGAKHEIGPATGVALGVTAGVKAVTPWAAPLMPVAPYLGTAIFLGGATAGGISGYFAGREAGEALIGPKAPVVPTLKASNNLGETLTFGVSSFATPMLWPVKALQGTGAVTFLTNFKQVAQGQRFANIADDAIEAAAAEAGLTVKQMQRAVELQRNPPGVMFSRQGEGIPLGVTRFNPSGKLFDPTKGPVGVRMISGVGEGIERSMINARNHPGVFLGFETLATGGAGLGAYGSETAFPGSNGFRFLSEITGAAAFPVIVKPMVQWGPDAIKNVYNLAKKYYTGESRGLFEQSMKQDAGRRVYSVMEMAFTDPQAERPVGPMMINADGDLKILPETAPDLVEQMRTFREQGYEEIDPMTGFIRLLEKAANDPKFQVAGEGSAQLTTATLAQAAGVPGAKALSVMENELKRSSDELALSSDKGRESFIQAAKSALLMLNKSGKPEDLAMAALIQRKLFEQNILEETTLSLTRLAEAFKRVYGTGENLGESQRNLFSDKVYEVLMNQLAVSKGRERQLWQQIPDFSVERFFAVDGSEVDVPNMLKIFDVRMDDGGIKFASKTAEADFNRALGDAMLELEEMRTFYGRGASAGAADSTAGGATDTALSGLGKEKTSIYQPALNMMPNRGDAPSGFRVFQRRGEEKGFVTTVVDSNGNKVELRLDPTDKVTPYTATIINGVGPDAYRAGATSDTLPLAGPNNVQEAIAMTRVRMSQGGDFVFTPPTAAQGTTAASTTAGTTAPASDPLNPPPFTFEKMYEYRSAILDRAAEARAAGKNSLAKRLDRYAAAILQDLVGTPLDQLPAGTGEKAIKAYNSAREYTKARNAVWNQGILGEMQKYSAETRDLRMDPSVFAHRLFQGGDNPLVNRVEQILNVPAFMKAQAGGSVDAPSYQLDKTEFPTFIEDLKAGEDIPDLMFKLVNDAQKKILSKRVDKETGDITYVVDPKKLEDYRNNPEVQRLMSIFPSLAQDLSTVESAQRLANSTLFREATDEELLTRSVLEGFLGGEKASLGVSKILTGKNPSTGLNELRRLIDGMDANSINPKTNQPFGKEGLEEFKSDVFKALRGSIFDVAITQSGGTGFSFSPKKMSDFLFQPLKFAASKEGKDFTIIDWMKSNKLIGEDEVGLIKKNLAEMIDVEAAFATGQQEKILFKNPTASKLMMTKILGATFGLQVQNTLEGMLKKIGITPPSGIGGGIIAAESGSDIVVNMLLRAPETATVNFMVEMLQNPRLMALMMREIKDAKDARNTFKAIESAISGSISQVGRRLPYVERAVIEEAEEPDLDNFHGASVTPQAPQQNLMAQRFARSQPTVIQPRPPMRAPTPVAQAPMPAPAPQQGGANPQQRQQLAAMFPNDPILGAAGGIGSLFG
jgi:hypothetical protein